MMVSETSCKSVPETASSDSKPDQQHDDETARDRSRRGAGAGAGLRHQGRGRRVGVGEEGGHANADEGQGRQDEDADERIDDHSEPFMRFRLTYIDSVQSSPDSLPPPPTAHDKSTPFIPARRIPFANSSISIDRVPEIRIFGATEAGQRCCIHLHGTLPYVYIEYEGKVGPEEIQSYINRLARAINACMVASLGRKDPHKSLFIAFVVPVKGTPFYGFHVGYRYFLKLYCLDPKYMTRLATLLRSGEIMKKKFIVYEAHIPFLLQFMLDFNLYGCGWVEISKAKFREPVPECEGSDRMDLQESSNESAQSDLKMGMPEGEQDEKERVKVRPRKPKRYTRQTIPPEMLYSDPTHSPPRVSHSALEIDIHVSWILNRHRIKERVIHNDFTEYLKNPIPDDFKFVHSVKELWEDERRRRKVKGLEGPFDVSENSAEVLGGMTPGTRRQDPDEREFGIGTQPPWAKFSKNQEQFRELVEMDRLKYAQLHPNDPIPRFDTFVRKEKKGGWMEKIMTTFKSVEALFEETMTKDELQGNPFGAWGVKGIGVRVPAEGRGNQPKNPSSDHQLEHSEDVNPAYLAFLSTQQNQEHLARQEREDRKLERAADQGGQLGESSLGDHDYTLPEMDEHLRHSDEEEGDVVNAVSPIQEKAKRRAEDSDLSRDEAMVEEREAESRQNARGMLGPSSDIDTEMLLDIPGAGQAAPSRTAQASNGIDQSSHSVTRAEEQDSDPDLALLGTLLPRDVEEMSDGFQHDDALAASTRYGATFPRSAEGRVSAEKVDMGENGTSFSPRASQDTGRTPMPFSTSFRPPSQVSPHKPSPFAPSPDKNGYLPSQSKISPTKANYFSPAKSKLRNAAINPNFVADSRAKRKREEQLARGYDDNGNKVEKLQDVMIGFRAIGDHGRTKLQQMLTKIDGGVTRQVVPKTKIQSVNTPGKTNIQVTVNEGENPSKKRRLSLDITSSEEEPEVFSDAELLAFHSENEHDSLHDPLRPVADLDSRNADPLDLNGVDGLEGGLSAGMSTQGMAYESDDELTPPVPTEIVYEPTQIVTNTEHEEAVDEAARQPTPQTTSPMVGKSDQALQGSDDVFLDRPAHRRRNVRFVSVTKSHLSSEAEDDGTAQESASEESDVSTEPEERVRDRASVPAAPPTPLLRLGPSSSLSGLARSSSGHAENFDGRTYRYQAPAPTLYQLLQSLDDHNLPHKIYLDPYWSNPSDIPSHAFEYAGRRYTHRGDANRFLPEFEHHDPVGKPLRLLATPVFAFKKWEYARQPPSAKAIMEWCQREDSGLQSSIATLPKTDKKGKNVVMDTQWAAKSQVQGPTQANPFGAKYAANKPSNAVLKEKEHMSSLAIEIHVNTRGSRMPDPAEDAIEAIFFCLKNEDDHIVDNGHKEGTHVGMIVVDDALDNSIDVRKLGLSRFNIQVVEDEISLIETFIEKVREWDPEIFVGYDVLKDSWGYLVERAEDIAPGLDIVVALSRVFSQSTGRKGSKDEDRWGYSKGATLRVTGRHVLPVWRLLKSDTNLTIYSFENVVFHVLRQRVPRFSYATLTNWYTSAMPHLVARVLQYHLMKVQLVIDLLDEAEIVSRNAEFARVFGVDFYSVLTRGSQFKVESVMFKISKPESFMLPSPSREDVGRQNAAECIPLILEPESGFYSSPLLVFDFQSLYPSAMIAYNLCYSTCLGRLKEFLGTNRLGTSSLAVPPGALYLLKDWIILSPNGLMFVKPQIRRSLISKMLTEILDTRVMVKKSMKLIDADDVALSRILNARQLGLKFIANVTYGYTSATFSGRMPCVEIADAIVQTGRETLERAKTMIQLRKEWGAVVRYGDTDSLFVHLPGKTKDEAFQVGNAIADAITRTNPKPVKLKFEKVYLPSFLLAKKRYVGFKYESQSDTEPEFDAKGIETVRRDGFPAMQKMLETCIKILFRTSDLSSVRLYVQQQFSRIMQNRVSPQDFIYAKEVKMGSYSADGVPPPGAFVTARRMEIDPRAEALYGERVPYIISKGMDGPKAKQAHRALTPEEFLEDRENALDDEHYIGRIVKTLNRLFNLVGVDVQEWWNSTPRRTKVDKVAQTLQNGRIRVDQHFTSAQCPVCGGSKPNKMKMCATCTADSTSTALVAQSATSCSEAKLQKIRLVCSACAKLPVHETSACDSVDCPNLYTRIKASRELDDVTAIFDSLDISALRQRGRQKITQQEPYLIV